MAKNVERMQEIVRDSIEVKRKMLEEETTLDILSSVVEASITCLREGGKLLFCGNGGSAADAQHIAAELSGRFYLDRAPLFAEALHVNTSYLTSVANDYDYNSVYSRAVQAKGRKGDLLFGISTSGNSPNVIEAMKVAKELGMITVGMTGAGGGKMSELCDYLLDVPSKDTPRIQESHILLGHILCELVEKELA